MKTMLAGDIGGTKTNLAIFSLEAGAHTPIIEETFPSAQYDSLIAIARKFLSQVEYTPTVATFGVAGPVIAGKATITNLPWRMSETNLAKALGLESVCLLNDLVAIANAVPILEPNDVYTLNQGVSVEGGAIGVVAPGTGLGEAYLTWDGRQYHAYASEGGHADFAPTTPRQTDLLCYLQQKRGHVSFESVCSGKGLPNIYNFLKDTGVASEPDWLALELASATDPTPVIVNSALSHNPPDLCRLTLEIFVEILAGETGNMALKVLAAGGMYLGGGIPPRILPLLQTEQFMAIFKNKGRFAALLEKIPVHIILNSKAALFGAARYGLNVVAR